ncbi:2-keto-4-pentenoate hydratase [Alkalilimnicola sp. S0819]|uniref:2-keto-4-pentenoate hydratase n=1 Tax=Alkalilimnicola sp. S0819 TaxID=2613922 RepID=UPI001261A7BB|nr:fumarylacetoacetate hydrolase family protein [Alkalilimnicola sp. S0819]KAB7623384.1 decarboxylase [Alkalilimnicola sp. S0819]MPQ16926.1 decarboxylase [Alkalilimnicola sp. S0819]
MSQHPAHDAWAREMKQAQDQAHSLQPFSRRPQGLTLAQAYALADEVHRARLAEGAVAVGRKIGFTNPRMWARYGVNAPIWAHVYRHSSIHLTDDQARCPLAGFVEPKLEPELVLHLADTPAPDGGPEQLLRCLDWVAQGFEIVQSHVPDWDFSAADTVADAALHGRLYIGTAIPAEDLTPARLRDFTVELYRGEQLEERGGGVDVLGSPLQALAHLQSTLHQAGAEPLRAGEIITTGTLTPARSIRAGETWHSRVQGLPLAELTVSFA